MKKELKKVNVVIGAFGNTEGCNGIVEKVETPESGGIFTKYVGCNYLYKGYPEVIILDYIYASKKIFSGLTALFLNKYLRVILGFTGLMALIFKKKVIIPIMDYFLNIAYWIEYKYQYALPKEKYCVFVRELYDVSEKILNKLENKK